MNQEYDEEILDGDDIEEVDEYYDEIEESEGLGAEIREQLRAAPWYVMSAFGHMVVLLLLMLIPTNPPQKKKPPIVISTSVVEEEEVKEEEEEEELEELDPLEEIMETTEASTPSETVVETNIKTDVEIDTNIEIEDTTDLGDPTEDGVADAGEDLTPKLMGVRTSLSGGGLSSGFRGNVANVGKGLKSMLGKKATSGRGLLLVWLLDQSASMKDDQEAIAKQAVDIQDLLTDGGSKKMMSAVVTYGETWDVTQRPTSSASKIQEKIRNVQIDKSGIENTNQAIIYVCQTIMKSYSDYTKVIVLLSDESSGDQEKHYQPPKASKPGAAGKASSKAADNSKSINVSGSERKMPFIEVALKNLIRYRTRLFVIGKESPFQSNYVRESYTDETGRKWHNIYADRGPETPRIEVPVSYCRNTTPGYYGGFTGELKAGYGVYDLAYLAKGSKGAYFILEDKTTTVRRAMTFSERMRNPLKVDWKVMDNYTPDIVSRASYDRRIQAEYGKYGKAIVTLNGFYREHGDKINRYMWCRPPSKFKENMEKIKLRTKVIKKVINYLANARASDKELFEAKDKRQIANVDLYYCVALADQIITDSWDDAYSSYRGSTADNNTEQYWHEIRIQAKKGAKLSGKDKATYDERMRKLVDACNDVIRRHPNTPYAIAAKWVPDGARRWGVPAEMVYMKHKRVKHKPRPKQ